MYEITCEITAYKMKNKTFDLILGPSLFAVFCILPIPFSLEIRGTFGTLTWMTWWWVRRPVHLGVTGFIPILVCAVFGFAPVAKLLPSYASPIILLIMGADMLTVSWAQWGLDRRIAIKALCLIGSDVKQQVVIWFVVSVVLSIFLPNVVVGAILCPVAVAMLKHVGLGDDIGKSRVSISILLAIAWGASLGGFGSPMGGAMNLLTIGFIERLTGNEYVYSSWVINMFPFLLVCTIVTCLYLISFKYEQKSLPGTKAYFSEQFSQMPPMSQAERVCLWLFLIANALAFFRPLYANFLPTLLPAYAFLLCGFLTFVLPAGTEGKRISTWEYAAPKMMWGLYYLFAGGLALGELLSLTGAGPAIAGMISSFNVKGILGLITIFTFFASFLGNITSNTAAVAITLPIVMQITQGLNLNPIPFLYITSIACNQAYILPTSVRAIPVGYGLDPADMVKPGWVVVILNCAVTISLGYLLILFWPRFSS